MAGWPKPRTECYKQQNELINRLLDLTSSLQVHIRFYRSFLGVISALLTTTSNITPLPIR
jgi:hypothetical protein